MNRTTRRVPPTGNNAAGSAGTVPIHAYAGIVPSDPTNVPSIRLRGCRQHNLRNLDLDIPLGKLTVVTGPSGSGKSSLAFHTLYAEGQRRYVETFSPYVRQFFDRMDKPEVGSIEEFHRPSQSNKKTTCARRGRPSARSPRSTTISSCSSRGWRRDLILTPAK